MILEKLIETNLEQTVGYGEDPYCEHARELIRKAAQARRRMCIFWWEEPRLISR